MAENMLCEVQAIPKHFEHAQARAQVHVHECVYVCLGICAYAHGCVQSRQSPLHQHMSATPLLLLAVLLALVF
jgi:hypothetical protein